jgi:hypothetical protein
MGKNRTAYKALLGKPNLKRRHSRNGKIIEGNSQFKSSFWSNGSEY